MAAKALCPPEWKEGMCYDEFRKRIKVWQLLKVATPEQEGPLVFCTLSGKAEAACEELTLEQIGSANGLDLILAKLDALYHANKDQKFFVELDTFEKFRRPNNMKEKGRSYKKFIAKIQKNYNKKFHKDLRKFKKRHPKDYWALLKKEEGLDKKESKVPLRTFEKHFHQLNQSDSQQIHNILPETIDSFNQDINVEFTLDELYKNIKFLNNNKSSGIDLIKNEYLKNAPQNVIELAVKLFNLILKTGIVPLEWCLGCLLF